MRSLTARRAVATSLLCFAALSVTGCASISRHQFTEPAAGWQTRTGQLMYRSTTVTLAGDVIVRFSKSGDFALIFSKAGITVLTLRQDANFGEVKGGLGDRTWTGPVERAPKDLRAWLALRDQFLRSANQKTLRYVSGSETFLFRF
jgi:hypothetical protein